jgi:hypothetical protein
MVDRLEQPAAAQVAAIKKQALILIAWVMLLVPLLKLLLLYLFLVV